MRTYEFFKSKIVLKYYGSSDIQTQSFIRELLDKYNDIINCYNSIGNNIENIDDFKEFLLLRNIVLYEEAILHLNSDEDKNKLIKLIEETKDVLSTYDKAVRNICLFINNHHEELLLLKDDHFQEHYFVINVLDYIFINFKYIDKKVFKYIKNRHFLHVLTNFENWKSYFVDNLDELEEILNNIYLKEKDLPYSYMSELLIKYHKSKFSNSFNKYALILCDKAIEMAENITLENCLDVYNYFESIYKVAKAYKLNVRLRKLEKLKVNIEDIIKEYAIKYGKINEIKYSYDEVLECLKKKIESMPESSFDIFLDLTHILNKDGLFEPVMCSVFKNTQITILDSIKPLNTETNNRFTASVQFKIGYYFKIFAFLIEVVFRDNKISSAFTNTLINVFENVVKYYKIENQEIILELKGIIDSIVFLITKDIGDSVIKTLYFGLSQNICSFIEKLLRKITVENIEPDLMSFLEEDLTLGSILVNDVFSRIIREKIGNDFVDILQFELVKKTENEKGLNKVVGKNLRNKLMHNNNLDYLTEINISLVFRLFYILIIIINQLEVNRIKNNR